MNERNSNILITSTVIGVVALVILASIFGIYGTIAFGKNFSRHQRLADERNQIQVNEIQIQQTHQLVQVASQKADIKIEEAKGIAESQRIINDTLTPQYLQHEAIQAQESQSNKIIYVPSGNQGIPLVNNVGE
jgi:hypothetical protein